MKGLQTPWDVNTCRPLSFQTLYDKQGTLKSPIVQLQEVLQHWKDVAASSGVQVVESNEASDEHRVDAAMLRIAESCRTWRKLYGVLDERETKRRENQGARMRQRRKQLAHIQPKIVKVKPAKAKHDAILNRPFERKSPTRSFGGGGGGASGGGKIHQLRQETAVAASWQKAGSKRKSSGSAFGDAVAFASAGKATGKRKPTRAVQLSNGKRMKVPTAPARTAMKVPTTPTRAATRVPTTPTRTAMKVPAGPPRTVSVPAGRTRLGTTKRETKGRPHY